MTLRTNQRLTSPAGYVGGKCRIAPHIIKRLPSDRACYVEVFGGMGHVMTQKAPEANEVFNDIQSIVVTFWLVLRDHREPLIERVRGMPYSREDHARLAGCLDAIQGRAIVSYYEHDLIDTLYPKGKWKRATIGTFKSACPLVRGGAQTRPRSTELLLMNFDARTGRRLDERGRSRSRRAARS